VEEIASEAGFSTGALYSNFDGKEDLFLALMKREIAENARLGGDLLHARAVEPLAREHAARGQEKAFARLRAALLARQPRRRGRRPRLRFARRSPHGAIVLDRAIPILIMFIIQSIKLPHGDWR
jgi:AcrR family transcriptional regulator